MRNKYSFRNAMVVTPKCIHTHSENCKKKPEIEKNILRNNKNRISGLYGYNFPAPHRKWDLHYLA